MDSAGRYLEQVNASNMHDTHTRFPRLLGKCIPGSIILLGMTSCMHSAPTSTESVQTQIVEKAIVNPVVNQVEIPAGLSSHVIYHEDRERYYLLYRPHSVGKDQQIPLIMAFHGGGGVPENIVEVSDFNNLAERHGFAVVYPSGSGSTANRLFWNILLSGTYATVNNLDDLGFISKVMDDVSSLLAVDTNRIYAAGFSQGGMLCYRLACDPVMSSRIAAIAVISATMTVSPSQCEASRPVPVISFHGKKDQFSSYPGGIAEKAPRNDLVPRPGLEESIRYWIQRGQLSIQPSASGTIGSAHMQQYGPDQSGFEIVSWVFDDGGHTWPGSNSNLPEWMMGKINYDVSASVLIWDFFARHPLR